VKFNKLRNLNTRVNFLKCNVEASSLPCVVCEFAYRMAIKLCFKPPFTNLSVLLCLEPDLVHLTVILCRIVWTCCSAVRLLLGDSSEVELSPTLTVHERYFALEVLAAMFCMACNHQRHFVILN